MRQIAADEGASDLVLFHSLKMCVCVWGVNMWVGVEDVLRVCGICVGVVMCVYMSVSVSVCVCGGCVWCMCGGMWVGVEDVFRVCGL